MYHLKSLVRVSLIAALALVLGCTSGVIFQRGYDKTGKIIIESRKYDINTTEVYLVHKTVSGEVIFFKLPNTEFSAVGWFTYSTEIDPQRPSGMTAVGGKGEFYIRQKGKNIGKPFVPYFDDFSNPFWGVSFDEQFKIEKIKNSMNLPEEPPQTTPSVWKLEELSSVDDEKKSNFHFSNQLLQAVASDYNTQIVERGGEYYIGGTEFRIGFMVQVVLELGKYRVIAFSKEEQPDKE